MSSKVPDPGPSFIQPSADRCAVCPPDRVCAWACTQGAGVMDCVIGAMLEQSDDWSLASPAPAEVEPASRALWETYNG